MSAGMAVRTLKMGRKRVSLPVEFICVEDMYEVVDRDTTSYFIFVYPD